MTDPYKEIRALRARLARIEAAASGIDPKTRVWTTAEIADRETWTRNRDEIMVAQREGRIVEAEPEAPRTLEYPPSAVPGWHPVGVNIFAPDDPAAARRIPETPEED